MNFPAPRGFTIHAEIYIVPFELFAPSVPTYENFLYR